MLLGEIKKSPPLFHKNDGITEEFKKEELEEKKKGRWVRIDIGDLREMG